MAIKPFVDRTLSDVGTFQKHVSPSGGMDTTEIDRHRQGINVRGMQDYRFKLSPYISSKGFPEKASDRFNPSLEVNHWGQPKLFLDPAPAVKPGFDSGPGPAPFDDIVGIFDPIQFINDTGTQMYPTVLLSPNWLDPAQMDSIVEPLAIRHKMSNTMTEGPYEAHQIRATLQPNTGIDQLGKGIIISRFLEFEPRATIPPYFDSQNEAISDRIVDKASPSGFRTIFSIPAEGYAFPFPRQIKPFDDAIRVNPTTINFSTFEVSASFDDLGSFIDDPRLGIFGKSSHVGFIYREGAKHAAGSGISGNRRVNGTDSIAFGGLLK